MVAEYRFRLVKRAACSPGDYRVEVRGVRGLVGKIDGRTFGPPTNGVALVGPLLNEPSTGVAANCVRSAGWIDPPGSSHRRGAFNLVTSRVVMVGARFPSGPDAFDGSRDGYGVYAQARAVATLLAGPGRWPRAAPAWREWALILLSAILLAGLLWSERARRPLPALAVGAALAALLLAALGAMAGGLELPVAEVILGLAAGSCAGGFP